MKIRTDEIASLIKEEIEGYQTELEVSEVGKVLEVGDGIARVYGLSGAMASELLEFDAEDGTTVMGQVFNLEEDSVGAVLFGDDLKIK
jgi:F-type H+-transporting ATPase subunit alpha